MILLISILVNCMLACLLGYYFVRQDKKQTPLEKMLDHLEDNGVIPL